MDFRPKRNKRTSKRLAESAFISRFRGRGWNRRAALDNKNINGVTEKAVTGHGFGPPFVVPA